MGDLALPPSGEDQACAIGRTWRVGRYRLEHEPSGLWGASDGARGVAARRGPATAIWALWRLRREYDPNGLRLAWSWAKRYRRNSALLRRSNLDCAASVLLGLCYRIEIETDLYLRGQRRDVERLAQVHREVQSAVEKVRKTIA